MKDNAVTPVVGVMLILSITIIAVAVVSAFAGGAIKTTEKSPSAEYYVSTSGTGDYFKLVFEHKGGDAISTADIKVTTLIKDSDSTENSFMLSKLENETWSAGEIIKTENFEELKDCLGTDKATLKNKIDKSTPLEIKMYHTPTSTIIYQSAILLEKK